jgi:hypothetical protein
MARSRTCALAGDTGIPSVKFSTAYPSVFNADPGTVGSSPAALLGFFGDREENDQEWDSNGEALWAVGRFDRICGPTINAGEGSPSSEQVHIGLTWFDAGEWS